MRLIGMLLAVGIIALLAAYYMQYGNLTLRRSINDYGNINHQVDRVKDDLDKYNGIINTYEQKLNPDSTEITSPSK